MLLEKVSSVLIFFGVITNGEEEKTKGKMSTHYGGERKS